MEPAVSPDESVAGCRRGASSPEHWCLQTCIWAFGSPQGLRWRSPGSEAAGETRRQKHRADVRQHWTGVHYYNIERRMIETVSIKRKIKRAEGHKNKVLRGKALRWKNVKIFKGGHWFCRSDFLQFLGLWPQMFPPLVFSHASSARGSQALVRSYATRKSNIERGGRPWRALNQS